MKLLGNDAETRRFPEDRVAKPLGPLRTAEITEKIWIARTRTLCSIPPVMANPTNVLSNGIEITGSIRFTNDMIIDGKINGEIMSDKGRVTIGENAAITGDITAGEVKVYGKVEGKITSQRCELKDKSRINGDIKSKVFSMEEGAQLSGRTDIGG